MRVAVVGVAEGVRTPHGHARSELVADAEAGAPGLVVRGVAFQGVTDGRQAAQRHVHFSGVVLVLALHRHFTEQTGLLVQVIQTLQADAQALGVAFLVTVLQCGRSGAVLGIAVHFDPRIIGLTKGLRCHGLSALWAMS